MLCASLIKRVLKNFVLDGFSPHPISAAVLEALDVEFNEVLMPNPFDWTRAVFMLAVEGAEGPSAHVVKRFDLFFNKVISLIFNFQASWLGGTYVAKALEPMTEELTIPLASGASIKSKSSYVKAMSGEATQAHILGLEAIFNQCGTCSNTPPHKADREFIGSLVSLICNIRRAMQMHQDLFGIMKKPAELIRGSFDGIKVVQVFLDFLFRGLRCPYKLRVLAMVELFLVRAMGINFSFVHWAPNWVLEEGFVTEGFTRKEWSYSLLQLQIYSTPHNQCTKVLQERYGTEGVSIKEWSYSLLQLQRYSTPYSPCTKVCFLHGKFFGVILSNETPSQESETVLNVMFTSQPSARWLEETTGLPNSKDVAEVLLVRGTLAWVTRIILLVATIMGVGNWSRWLMDLFGIQDNDSAEDETNHDDNSEMICVKFFKAFRLFNACR
ncbi:hypothetical protein RHMOL_Rhmol09G0066300 [Rhododendron molle]|uniref:Uncharacterized protein n=1 Tax=Rhododendron molle TaxID=49168 RepID=A0ACC0MAW5_RHOML|nr:hypothetical protein RHMOL_Rhmol09G0066300 [Rhododendron molle]